MLRITPRPKDLRLRRSRSAASSESVGDGKCLVKVGPGYVQSESGPFVLDLGLSANRAMAGTKAGGAVGLLN
jgi:hypothetical protein